MNLVWHDNDLVASVVQHKRFEALSPSIDRVIHLSVILDMMALESYRTLQATH
jgi:hypothetical protein